MPDSNARVGGHSPLDKLRAPTRPLAVPEAELPQAPAVAVPPGGRDALGTHEASLEVPGGALDLDALGPLDHVPEAPPHVDSPKGGVAKTLAAVGVGVGAAVVLDTVHTELQSTRKGYDSYLKLHTAIDKYRRFTPTKPPDVPPVPKTPTALVQPLEKPLTGVFKAFEVAKVAKGVDSAFSIYYDAKVMAKDLQSGEYKKAGVDVLKTLTDGVGVLQGTEAGLKLAGKEITLVNREMSVLGGVVKKVPILGIAFGVVDFTSKSVELVRGVDSSGKPLTVTKRASDSVGMVADVALVAAAFTPPPVDLVLGAVAAGATIVQLGIDHWDKVEAGAQAIGHGAAVGAKALAHAIAWLL